MDFDFSGYATRNDIRCSDGRVIRHDAFKDNDGQTVPLVYQHVHDDPKNVLGHAYLENRDDGVYCYGKFNNTESGKHAKEMVANGDITSMSIYANRLKQHGSDVIHGMIREVSLVLTGANPGAYIENVSIAHADGSYTESEDEAVIYSGLEDSVESIDHADDDNNKEDGMADQQQNNSSKDEKTVQDVFDSLTDEQKDVVYFLIGNAVENAKNDDSDNDSDESVKHADNADDKTVQDVFDSLTDEQKNVVYFLIGQALENKDNEAKHSDFNDGGSSMKHNVFDNTTDDDFEVLNRDEINEVLRHADSHTNSLKAYMEENGLGDLTLEHSVSNLDILYPEARSIRSKPDMIMRNQDWVNKFWNAVKRTPFAKFKSSAANLTEDAARAKGYLKGNQKLEEVFPLLGRETSPQTVYKKQKLDRDDIIDITDIDIVAWLKEELRVMLIEELCRAMLVSDGRGSTAPDKIKEDKIRPIYQDDNLYTIHYLLSWDANATNDDIAEAIVDGAVRSRKEYRGSGNPLFFATNDVITNLLLAKDTIGRRLYKDEAELAAALRVKEIIEVPVMEGAQRKVTVEGVTTTYDLQGIIVNPGDYTVGTDKGGAVTLFDDFDIDYNQQKYLLETRCSGALTVPYSAIALETVHE